AEANGVFVVEKQAGSAGTIQTEQLKAGGGEGFIAAVQPGNNSISFAVVDNSGTSNNGNGNGRPVDLGNTATTPLPPTDVAASAASATSVVVGWTDNSNNETGFLIERSVDGTTYVTAGQVAPNVTSFVDEGLDEATTYYYRVSA